MQVKRLGGKTVIDFRNFTKDELALVAEVLVRINETINPHGLSLAVKPVINPFLDFPVRNQ